MIDDIDKEPDDFKAGQKAIQAYMSAGAQNLIDEQTASAVHTALPNLFTPRGQPNPQGFTRDGLRQLRANLIGSKQLLEEANSRMNAEARQKDADTRAKTLAMHQDETDRDEFARIAGNAKTKDEYAASWYPLMKRNPKVAAMFPHPDTFDPETTPEQALLVGVSPAQQPRTQIEQEQLRIRRAFEAANPGQNYDVWLKKQEQQPTMATLALAAVKGDTLADRALKKLSEPQFARVRYVQEEIDKRMRFLQDQITKRATARGADPRIVAKNFAAAQTAAKRLNPNFNDLEENQKADILNTLFDSFMANEQPIVAPAKGKETFFGLGPSKKVQTVTKGSGAKAEPGQARSLPAEIVAQMKVGMLTTLSDGSKWIKNQDGTVRQVQ